MAGKRKPGRGREPNTPRNYNNNRNGKKDEDYTGLYLSSAEIAHCRKIRFAEGRGACFKCGNFFSPSHKCNASTAERTKWVAQLRSKMASGDTTPSFPLIKPKADRGVANAALTARLAKLEAQLAQHEMAAPVAPVVPESKTAFEAEAWMSSQIGSLPEAQQREVLLWTLQKKVGRMLGRLGAPGAARAAQPRSPAKPPPPANPVLPLEPRRISSEPDAPTLLQKPQTRDVARGNAPHAPRAGAEPGLTVGEGCVPRAVPDAQPGGVLPKPVNCLNPTSKHRSELAQGGSPIHEGARPDVGAPADERDRRGGAAQ